MKNLIAAFVIVASIFIQSDSFADEMLLKHDITVFPRATLDKIVKCDKDTFGKVNDNITKCLLEIMQKGGTFYTVDAGQHIDVLASSNNRLNQIKILTGPHAGEEVWTFKILP